MTDDFNEFDDFGLQIFNILELSMNLLLSN